ncbi:MAG: FAD-binding oxidoreductase [Proteobacteria bacterium]|nr:FAD-binding oxidoreductase [Pseudomonadota bacterium]
MDRRRFILSSGLTAALALPTLRAWGMSPDIQAVTADGRDVVLKSDAVRDLAAQLRGNVLLPGDPTYDKARWVWNAQMLTRRPALIVQPRGAADVSAAVQFARASNLLLAVKCGGHSPSGKSTCHRGLLIDLSLLRGVRVDPAQRLARVAGGSLLGDLDREAMAHGLVTTAGTVSHTGVGGLTLGGGFGRVARRFGLSLDNLRSVEIVTASGEILRAAPDENAELFWGTRGGGGNFGVVTGFDFGLHPMQRQVVGGVLMYPLSMARQVMRFYSEYEAAAPDELYLSCAIASNNDFSGRSGIAFLVCHSGSPQAAAAAMRDLRALGKPVLDTVTTMDYVALQRSGDLDEKRAIGSYTKTGFVRRIEPGLIDAMVDGLAEHPERAVHVGFQHVGGAASRIAADATAFPHRSIHATALLTVDWPGDVEPSKHIEWLLKYWGAIVPHTNGFYTNDATEETQKQLDENYLGNLPRLMALKKRYDPTNLFRLNANVRPG